MAIVSIVLIPLIKNKGVGGKPCNGEKSGLRSPVQGGGGSGAEKG